MMLDARMDLGPPMKAAIQDGGDYCGEYGYYGYYEYEYLEEAAMKGDSEAKALRVKPSETIGLPELDISGLPSCGSVRWSEDPSHNREALGAGDGPLLQEAAGDFSISKNPKPLKGNFLRMNMLIFSDPDRSRPQGGWQEASK